ncbi:MAG: hypothetical protein IJU57_03150 [Clostridia bacterium]|nr:hypothetical protein [Clostridia bacterium]
MKTTDNLTSVLKSTHPNELKEVFESHWEKIVSSEKPFSDYMKGLLKQRGLKQQDIFLAADISERYGYKLINEEKHTRQRDTIIRLCLAGKFTLLEAQRALKIYGMPSLYAKIPRDAVLIIAFNTGIYEISSVNSLLSENGLETLRPCSQEL